jgi:hypothetical protein
VGLAVEPLTFGEARDVLKLAAEDRSQLTAVGAHPVEHVVPGTVRAACVGHVDFL